MAGASGIRAGKAFVEIGADDAPLRATLAKVTGHLRAFGLGLAKVGLAAGAAALAAVATGVGAAVSSFVSAGSAVNDMAIRTGMAVDEIQKLGYAAKVSGADMDTVETGVRKMQKTITAAANGSKEAAASISRLGLSVSDLSSLSPDQQFNAIARAIGSIQNPTERAAAAIDLFGRGSGTRLLPMIQDLDALKAKAAEVGGVMSGADVAAADALGDSWDTMTTAIQGVSNAIGTALAPALTTVLGYLTSAIATVSQWIRDHYGYITTLANMAVDAVVAVWGFVKPALMPVVDFLSGAVVDAFIAGVTVVSEWRNVLQIAFVAVELAAVRTFNQIVYFLTEVVPGYLSWFADNWASVFVTIYDYTSTVIKNLYANLQEFFVQVVNWLAGEGFNFEWKGLTDGFESSIKELPKIAEREIGAAEGALQGQLDALSGKLVDKADSIRAKLKSTAGEVQAERDAGQAATAPSAPKLSAPIAAAVAATKEVDRAIKAIGAFGGAAIGQLVGGGRSNDQRQLKAAEATATGVKKLVDKASGDGLVFA